MPKDGVERVYGIFLIPTGETPARKAIPCIIYSAVLLGIAVALIELIVFWLVS